jgi:hypothetical protein
MPRDVRTHTRTDPRTGRRVTVQHHSRRGAPARKRGPNPSHAGRMVRRAVAHGRRGRKGKALMFGAVAATEAVLWVTLTGTAQILTLVAAILVGLSIVLAK